MAAHLRIYVTPRAILTGAAAKEAVESGWAWPLLGTMAYAAIDVSMREGGPTKRLGAIIRAAYEKDARHMPSAMRAAIEAQMAALAAPRATFAGFDLARTVIMGVLNVTPDSFSDGGRYTTAEGAVAHAAAMADAGADLIDVGGESTRPGAAPLGEQEELARVAAVVRALRARNIAVSIDTRQSAVMRDAISAGAAIVNDITALTGDPRALETVAQSQAAVVLMHMQGTPATMQDSPHYEWAPADVYDFLADRVAGCVAAGIPKARIAVDPGIGFGKTDKHNAQLLDHLGMFHGLGCTVALGASRKGFIGRVSKGEGADGRLPGSLAIALDAASKGAQILRVHDVAETRQALAVAGRLTAGN